MKIQSLYTYLPYNVGIAINKNKSSLKDNYEFYCIMSCRGNETNLLNFIGHSDFKLILKPISELYKLIFDEFEKYNLGFSYDKEIIYLFDKENGYDELIENIELKSVRYECAEYIFKNHYDIFGLIDKGEAVDYKNVKF